MIGRGDRLLAASLDLEGVLDCPRAATFFYPGSSIGNFTPETRVAFLGRRSVRQCAGRPGSGLLIGVDGKKETGASSTRPTTTRWA